MPRKTPKKYISPYFKGLLTTTVLQLGLISLGVLCGIGGGLGPLDSHEDGKNITNQKHVEL